MLKKLSLSIFLSLSFFSLKAQDINSANSKVEFSIKNMGIKKVHGTFTAMEGHIHFNSSKISDSHMEVCIDPATVNTGSEKRDKHLKNEDFFDVERYPEICFNATEIKKTNEGYLAIGKLQMHGISKTVEIPFKYNGQHISADFVINRLDYKVGESTGTFMVGDEVKLHIDCYIN